MPVSNEKSREADRHHLATREGEARDKVEVMEEKQEGAQALDTGGGTQTLTVNYLEYMAIRVVMSAGERLCYLVLGDMSSNSFSRQSAEGLSALLCSAAFRAEAFSSLSVELHGNVATGAYKAL